MPLLFPFRGYRYSSDAVQLSDVVTQPYDKISPEARQRYLARSPYNVAHVISNPNYPEAGRHFSSWIEQGLLRQDGDPSFYIYRQTFQVGGVDLERTGVIGLLDLESDQTSVLRHEQVMEAPLQDRLQLMGAAESNDGLIFMLIEDQARDFEPTLRLIVDGTPPIAEVRDEYEVLNQLWRVSDPGHISTVQRALVLESFYIADGHHRFETAIRFAESCRDRNWRPAAVESFDKRMIALFSSQSQGVVILATHRALRGLSDHQVANLLPRIESGFAVSRQPSPQALLESMGSGSGRLGLLLGPTAEAYSLDEMGAGAALPSDLTGSARKLDVNLLHRGILEPLLGIGKAELASQKHVDYYRDYREILPGLASGHYQLAFLLNPTRCEQVLEVSREGGRMPQKSTDFFPKLLTGLVFMKMEIARGETSTAPRTHQEAEVVR